jgi:hypothetical protein
MMNSTCLLCDPWKNSSSAVDRSVCCACWMMYVYVCACKCYLSIADPVEIQSSDRRYREIPRSQMATNSSRRGNKTKTGYSVDGVDLSCDGR